jgi:hypothetical protein
VHENKVIRLTAHLAVFQSLSVKKALELSAVPSKATELEKVYIASIVARRTSSAPDDYIESLRTVAGRTRKKSK